MDPEDHVDDFDKALAWVKAKALAKAMREGYNPIYYEAVAEGFADSFKREYIEHLLVAKKEGKTPIEAHEYALDGAKRNVFANAFPDGDPNADPDD